jgi:DNA-binding response OmpR family regulator
MNSPTRPDSPLVLVVDDDRALRTLLRFAMDEEGYQVVEANNGENCLAEFARIQPDIVLLDAVMPVMDGFTCCQQLRTLPTAQNTPVLMITVLDDQDSVDRAFEVGATDYVTKPIHWAVLRQRVARLLAASHSFKQVQQVTEALQKQTQREFWFRGMAQRLMQATVLQEVLNASVDEIREFLQVDCVATYHKNGDLTAQAIAAEERSPCNLSAKNLVWVTEYAPILEAGQVVMISDRKQEGIPTAVAKHLGLLKLQSALIAPILIHGQWWGFLEVIHSESKDWDLELVELLMDVANLMAMAIGSLD